MTLPSAQSSTPRKERTRSHLSALLEENLSTYVKAAGAAGVALLACAQPSEAKVIATKTDIVVPINGGVIQFDINGDGQPDFGLSAFAFPTSTCSPGGARMRNKRDRKPPPLGCPFDDQLRVLPAQAANEVLQHGTSYGFKCAADLALGVVIGPSRPFGTGTMDMYGNSGTSEGHQFCPWIDRSHFSRARFLGVKFLDTGGAVHYGWVRVTVDSIEATINGYGYETVPNRPLTAGEIQGAEDQADMAVPSDELAPKAPEPANLGRLAQGASGLAVWRRDEEVTTGASQ
jgi:hypothetical protein